MVKEDQSAGRSGSWLLKVIVWGLLVVAVPVAATKFLLARWLEPATSDQPAVTQAGGATLIGSLRLFDGWPTDRKPDLALVLTAEGHGYMQPCGCSRPQLGGLERRFTFIQSLRQKGWPVVAADLGDLPDPEGKRGPQGMLKYTRSMEALKKIGYSAIAIGQLESDMQLLDAVANYAINETRPQMLAANLLRPEVVAAGAVRPYHIEPGKNGAPTVGIVGTVGPSVAKQVRNQQLQFASNAKVLPEMLENFKKEKDRPEVLVLLYQGSLEEARLCARNYPQFHVILCLSKEEEPSDKPEKIGNTLVVGVGHKGRYLGVVGFFGNPGNEQRPFDLRYQLVALGEEYQTPEGKEATNPIVELMENYAKEVKAGNYLAKYPQRPHPLQVDFPKAEYVGSEVCGDCHKASYQVWAESNHAHAYQSLVKATRPSLRQFDGECIACHVVGFGHKTGFTSEKDTPDLINVGCESCHGPGSAHLNNPKDKKLHALMNPFRVPENETSDEMAKRITRLDTECQKCHDTDNDVHWNFQKKWPFIVHREPKKKKDNPE